MLGKQNWRELTHPELTDIRRRMELHGVKYDRDCMNHERYLRLQRGRRKRRRQAYFGERHEQRYEKVTVQIN